MKSCNISLTPNAGLFEMLKKVNTCKNCYSYKSQKIWSRIHMLASTRTKKKKEEDKKIQFSRVTNSHFLPCVAL